jgi:MFS family permease
MSADATTENEIEPTPTVDGKARSPWAFVPSLYFMQGLPVMVVQQMSATMYKSMGVDNAQIGLWTSLIAFPWIVKLLWGPLVDTSGTKRGWIVTMQALLIAALGLLATTITQSAFLPLSLAAMFLIAFFSATHDIAADGFYLLALKEKAQAFFVGIRSACFRLATIFCTGVLVVIAGRLEKTGTPIPQAWAIALGGGALVYGLLYIFGLWAYPRPIPDVPQKKVDVARILASFGQILLMVLALFLMGRLLVIGAGSVNSLLPKPIFTKSAELTPLFLPTHASHLDEVKAIHIQEEVEKSGKPATDEGAVKAANARPKPFFSETLAIPYAFQLLISLAIIGTAFFSTRELFRRTGMGPAASEYFGQDRIVAILGFILFYRFGESMISKMSSPFLLDPPAKGGLGVSTEQVGYITGTVGIIALTVGGLLGGWLISKFGIKKCIWPMVLSLNIPNLFYVWAAFAKPGVGAVTGLIAVDQFGYGFGFAAYMVYLMFLSQGSKMQTSHYAISTGLMALGAQVAGIMSGYLQMAFAGSAANPNPMAYGQFFIAVCFCTIPGMAMLFFIPMNKEDLKVAPVDID